MMGEANEIDNREELWSPHSTLQMSRKQSYVTAFFYLAEEGCLVKRIIWMKHFLAREPVFYLLNSYHKNLEGSGSRRLSHHLELRPNSVL